MGTIRSILKGYFLTGKKPTQGQFAALIDSLFHKDEDSLPISQVTNLSVVLSGKATNAQLQAVLDAIAASPGVGLLDGFVSGAPLVVDGANPNKVIVQTVSQALVYNKSGAPVTIASGTANQNFTATPNATYDRVCIIQGNNSGILSLKQGVTDGTLIEPTPDAGYVKVFDFVSSTTGITDIRNNLAQYVTLGTPQNIGAKKTFENDIEFKKTPTINGTPIGSVTKFADLTDNARANANLNTELNTLGTAVTTEATARATGDSNIIDAADITYNNLKKIQTKIEALQSLINGDDINLDSIKELADAIKADEATITALTNGKVNVSDIYNALDYVVAGKVLDARQGKALKDLIDANTTALNLKANIASPTFTGTVTAPTFVGALTGVASGNLTGTGTTNQIAKFTASGAVGNSSIFDNGNVGIGQSPGSRRLQITSADSEQLILTSTSATNLAGIFFNAANTTYTPFVGATENDIVFNTQGIERLRLSNSMATLATALTGTSATFNNGVGAGIARVANAWLILAASTSAIASFLVTFGASYTGTVEGSIWGETTGKRLKIYRNGVADDFLFKNANASLVDAVALSSLTKNAVGDVSSLEIKDAFVRIATAVNYTVVFATVGFGAIIGVTSTAAARTITLPLASTCPAGTPLRVVDESGLAGTNNITITRVGSDTINGATTSVINTNFGGRHLYSDGVSKWFLI